MSSFTEWIFQAFIDDDPPSFLLQTDLEFRHCLNTLNFHPSHLQFQRCISYLCLNIDHETLLDLFFSAKVLQKMADFTVALAKGRISQSTMDSMDAQKDSELSAVLEMLNLFTALINAASNKLTLTQIFSNGVISALLSKLKTNAKISQSASHYLLLKSIALKLDSENISLFFSEDGFPLFEISCGLPLDIDDHHLLLIQKTVVLLVTRLLPPDYNSNDTLTVLLKKYLATFVMDSEDVHCDDVVDHLLFIDDLLLSSTSLSPVLVDVFWTNLPKNLLILSLAFDSISPLNLSNTLSSLLMNIEHVSLFERFLHFLCLQILVAKCSGSSAGRTVLEKLGILPSKLIQQSSLLSSLTEAEEVNDQVLPLNQVRRRRSSGFSTLSTISAPSPTATRHSSKVEGFGPLDPSFSSDPRPAASLPPAPHVQRHQQQPVSTPAPSIPTSSIPLSINTSLKLYEHETISSLLDYLDFVASCISLPTDLKLVFLSVGFDLITSLLSLSVGSLVCDALDADNRARLLSVHARMVVKPFSEESPEEATPIYDAYRSSTSVSSFLSKHHSRIRNSAAFIPYTPPVSQQVETATVLDAKVIKLWSQHIQTT